MSAAVSLRADPLAPAGGPRPSRVRIAVANDGPRCVRFPAGTIRQALADTET
jgi:hypothetical protein